MSLVTIPQATPRVTVQTRITTRRSRETLKFLGTYQPPLMVTVLMRGRILSFPLIPIPEILAVFLILVTAPTAMAMCHPTRPTVATSLIRDPHRSIASRSTINQTQVGRNKVTPITLINLDLAHTHRAMPIVMCRATRAPQPVDMFVVTTRRTLFLVTEQT